MSVKGKVLMLLCLGLGFNLLSWALIFLRVPAENFPFIVKYNLFSGQDWFGNKTALFSLPGLGLIIYLVNAILILALLGKERNFAFLIGLMNLFWQFFVFIYALAIVFINSY